jgi:hypothetical protein
MTTLHDFAFHFENELPRICYFELLQNIADLALMVDARSLPQVSDLSRWVMGRLSVKMSLSDGLSDLDRSRREGLDTGGLGNEKNAAIGLPLRAFHRQEMLDQSVDEDADFR